MVASYLSFPSCRSIPGGLLVLQNGWMAGGGVVRITHGGGGGGGGFGRGNLKLHKAMFGSSSEIAFLEVSSGSYIVSNSVNGLSLWWIAGLNLARTSGFSEGKGKKEGRPEGDQNMAPRFPIYYYSIFKSIFKFLLTPPPPPHPSIKTNSTVRKRQFCGEVSKRRERE